MIVPAFSGIFVPVPERRNLRPGEFVFERSFVAGDPSHMTVGKEHTGSSGAEKQCHVVRDNFVVHTVVEMGKYQMRITIGVVALGAP